MVHQMNDPSSCSKEDQEPGSSGMEPAQNVLETNGLSSCARVDESPATAKQDTAKVKGLVTEVNKQGIRIKITSSPPTREEKVNGRPQSAAEFFHLVQGVGNLR